MRLPLGHARQQRQDRRGAVQRLHARLFVHTQHQGRLGQIQVPADDVADLVDALRIGRQLEGVDRCGLSPNARQIRLIADCDLPTWRASDRVDQWVASVGVVSSVMTNTCSTCSSVMVRAAPGRGSSARPSSRRATNRDRHLVTVGREMPSRVATAWLLAPQHRPARSDTAVPTPDPRCAAWPNAPVWCVPRRSARARAALVPAARRGLGCRVHARTLPDRQPTNDSRH